MVELRRFKNRLQAGKLLAQRLGPPLFHADAGAIVLALPRGGVPVGFAAARRLGIALDVLVVRKLGMPRHEEFAMGAVGGGGVRVLQPGVPGLLGVTQAEVDAVTARELDELQRRERAYHGGRPEPDLDGRSVILVDDGAATGATMLAAIQVTRRRRPRRLALAIPVAPPETVRKLAPQVDELVCLLAPPRFQSVGQWYDAFHQTSDEEVQDLLAAAWRQQATVGGRDSHPTGGPDRELLDQRHKS